MELWIGFAIIGVALLIGAGVLLAPYLHGRLRTPGMSRADALRLLGDRAATVTDAAMQRRGLSLVTKDELELAGVRMSTGGFVASLAGITIAVAFVGSIVAAALGVPVLWLLYVALVIAVPLGGRLFLGYRASKRRAKFADQLDDTLQLISSGLRAGHSLARAIDAVSREGESPTAEEFARIINENRLGMDLGEAIRRAARRMKSDDLAWTSQAVDIHREVGGNLSEVLDHVGETIRERNQIRRQVATLSSEGRISANVLMALPVGIALILSVISPGYLTVFVSTPFGWVMIAVSVVLFAVGAVWMRAITRIEF
jgi:tight adherence protein B